MLVTLALFWGTWTDGAGFHAGHFFGGFVISFDVFGTLGPSPGTSKNQVQRLFLFILDAAVVGVKRFDIFIFGTVSVK